LSLASEKRGKREGGDFEGGFAALEIPIPSFFGARNTAQVNSLSNYLQKVVGSFPIIEMTHLQKGGKSDEAFKANWFSGSAGVGFGDRLRTSSHPITGRSHGY
jgi:hypothetical protein